MHTVVSRPHPSRIPRKSSSFVSLRRDKDKSPPATDPPSSFHNPRPTYFERYPGAASSSTSNLQSSEYLSFPSTEEPNVPATVPKPFLRERSRTGPSSPSNWAERPAGPRISVTSTLTEGTPPDTPVDGTSFPDFDILVAAPVSGVEFMDALVDGMNGGDEIISSRSRFGIPAHHPLYQPPLPTPPPGVVLGGGKTRRRKLSKTTTRSSLSDEDEIDVAPPTATPRRKPRTTSPSPPSTARPRTAPSSSAPDTDRRQSLAPSISDIIRAYAPPEANIRGRAPLTRTSSYSRSAGHTTLREESEPEHERLAAEEEADVLSRSSIDSIADEVRRTLRHQLPLLRLIGIPFISDSASIISPRSDGGGAASIYSSSITSTQPPLSPFDSGFMANLAKPPTPSQAVAQYLRSARLTTLLKLTRSPHASYDNPLTVSLSDLGTPNGFPVLVFLGLGGVRHVMGLYDEMAGCLGLRLITIDRWGLGRTEARAKSAKGIIQWASVVEEVLDLLHIDQCSVMGHSAGAPYALSFANKLSHRIRGNVCLLAPWVGESAGYKWLKYVPNGILKTAQAAEWKLQTWMIGKPPTMAWEGIGYTPKVSGKKQQSSSPSSVYPSLNESHPRPSMLPAHSVHTTIFKGKSPTTSSPQLILPPTPRFDVELGINDESWTRTFSSDSSSNHHDSSRTSTPEKFPRSNGSRSMSLSSSPRPLNILSLPPSPSGDLPSPNNAYQALSATHSSQPRIQNLRKEHHNDLLQILNHDHHPGISYELIRTRCRCENAVRWMEKTMGEGRCSVRVVKGADHSLMYKSAVVVEVLEILLGFWR
ncbi:hypothetical protein BDP27DRAFT_1327801 [Rhodocollybia butyracea]|uniref:AB hydrolase-1 domain-containing protein n=1 Tax=Rhodocollybia butyracea TaxID=206335 RepID=A0A9P5PRB1_9AGAR|nr:hypothetical protein BDP27DRAFT_1327801 [Rhodocollybia butyracea]